MSTQDKMRICMLVSSYAPDLEGGAERQCRLLARHLKGRGHEVSIITTRRQKTSREGEVDGVAVTRLGSFLGLAEKSRRMLTGCGGFAFWLTLPLVWGARMSFLCALASLVRSSSGEYDVLHVHESGWLAGVGVSLGKKWGIPVVCKEATTPALGKIGFDTPGRKRWSRERMLADKWLALTSDAARRLQNAGISSAAIETIPNGVEIPETQPDPTAGMKVLYVGNLTQGVEWKAFDVLFAAWVEVAKTCPDAKLSVVGAGDPSRWLEQLTEQGVVSSVTFEGRKEDMAPHYSSSALFVLPSRVEGMSNALLEAQSWGLPCVVSDIPGNKAIVTDGVNGRTVPVGNVHVFSSAIIELLGDSNERRRLSAAARAKAEQDYDIKHVAGLVEGVYRDVIGALP